MKEKAKVKNQKSKITFVSFIVSILVLMAVVSVQAQVQTSTPSPTLVNSTKSLEDKEIQTLKDKLATRVAELRAKNNKAISGSIEEVVSPTKISKLKIKTWKDEIFEILIDQDLTKFYQFSGEQKKEVKPSVIKKGSYITVSGVIKEKSVEANFIYLDELFFVDSGSVTEVNKEDFFIKLITTDRESFTLDIQTSSKQQMLNIKTLNLEAIGFSKIKEGDTIHFVFKKTSEAVEPNRYSAQKILIVPQEYFVK